MITELPLRSWTTDYKDFLENMLSPKEKNAQPFITDYKEHHTDTTVHFIVTMTPENMAKAQKDGIEKKFKLCAKVSTSNMHAFDDKGAITKYSSPEAIMEAFVPLRLDAYARRRAMLIRQAEFELKRMSNKVRFILAVVDGEMTIGRKKKSVLIEELEAAGYDKMPKTAKAAAAADAGPAESGLSDISEEGAPAPADGASYDYLLSMPLWNLTQEKVDELVEEQRVKTAEVEELHGTTDKQLCICDSTFDAAMDVFDAEDAKAAEELPSSSSRRRNQTKGGKKALAKKKKAMRAMDSDEDSEEMRTSATTSLFPPRPRRRRLPPRHQKAPSARTKNTAAAASSATSKSPRLSPPKSPKLFCAAARTGT